MIDSDEVVNIFTINDPELHTGGRYDGAVSFEFPAIPGARDLGRELHGLLSQQFPWLRSALDPVAEQQRQAHLQRRKVVCLLNAMDQLLRVVHGELQRAASSMCRFGETHSLDRGPSDITTFIQDATLFLKEAVLPDKLEIKLSELETTADEFRSAPIQGPENACSDLQLDIAVLMESALMSSQQALAEYRCLLCRLQVLVTEYEPIYRHAISSPMEPTALLRVDLRDKVEEESLPAPEVKWVQEFTEMAGPNSRALAASVRELGQRAGRLRECAGDLRTLLVHGAA